MNRLEHLSQRSFLLVGMRRIQASRLVLDSTPWHLGQSVFIVNEVVETANRRPVF